MLIRAELPLIEIIRLVQAKLLDIDLEMEMYRSKKKSELQVKK